MLTRLQLHGDSLAPLWEQLFPDPSALPLFARWEWLLASGESLGLAEAHLLRAQSADGEQLLPLRVKGAAALGLSPPFGNFAPWATSCAEADLPLLQRELGSHVHRPIFVTQLAVAAAAQPGVVSRRAEGYLSLGAPGIPSRLRRNLGRIRRHTERRFGRLRVESVQDIRDCPDAFDRFLAIEGDRKRDDQQALAQSPAQTRFYRRLAELFSGAGLELDFLYFGDRPVATQFAIRSGRVHWMLRLGYAGAYRQYGPGAQLLLATLGRLPDPTTWRVVLDGPASWAPRWAPTVYPNCHLFSAGLPIAGRLVEWVTGAYWRRRRTRRMPRLEDETVPPG